MSTEAILGREHFDYVTMATYTADMAEASSHAAGIISKLKRENDQLEMMIWLLIRAAGGKIELYEGDIARFDKRKAEMIQSIMIDTRMRIFEAKELA